MQTKVLIVGGGLSGLHTAYECSKRGIDFILVEARDRFGGRVFSLNDNVSNYNNNQAAFDLGPSWFWAGQQRIFKLIDELGLSQHVFFQNDQGVAIYEDNQGNIQRDIEGISMAGAYRLRGGIRQLTASLSKNINEDCTLNNAVARKVKFAENQVTAMIENEDSELTITSEYLILAMPPRVALANIKFSPAFSDGREGQLNNIATWMAGHAKLVAVYENRFWLLKGLSGDVISHKGPLQEIHDASSNDGEVNALFGFVAVPPVHRKRRQDEIKALAISQLARLFGNEAASPLAVYLQDWADEKFTSTQYDQQIQRFHPANNIGYVSEPHWDKRLIWSGTEAADYSSHNNGFLEGALEASTYALSLLPG